MYLQLAKKLRSSQTPGEKAFWRRVRANRFFGYKFKRQVPVGPYIVDFLCFELRLIVEIDGDSHWQPGAQERDRIRENYVYAAGYRIIRFDNKDVIESTDEIMERLRLFVAHLSLITSP